MYEERTPSMTDRNAGFVILIPVSSYLSWLNIPSPHSIYGANEIDHLHEGSILGHPHIASFRRTIRSGHESDFAADRYTSQVLRRPRL